MSGAIIPEPLAKPAIVTGTPSSSTRATAPFGKVSVVMIARAARSAAPASSSAASRPSTATIRSAGSGSPITPVEATKTWLLGNAQRRRGRRDRRLAPPRRPAPPVKALELPEFTRIAKPPVARRRRAAPPASPRTRAPAPSASPSG